MSILFANNARANERKISLYCTGVTLEGGTRGVKIIVTRAGARGNVCFLFIF